MDTQTQKIQVSEVTYIFVLFSTVFMFASKNVKCFLEYPRQLYMSDI